MKVGITGANGFIGKALTSQLISVFDEVVILTRKPLVSESKKVHFVHGDLATENCPLAEFLKDCDIVFHCAGEIRNVELMKSLHVDGTQRLIQAIEQEYLRTGKKIHIIHLSSVGVYGPPIGSANSERVITEESPLNPRGEYEITKCRSDEIVIESAKNGLFDYTILRPSNVIGSGMSNNSLRILGKLLKYRLFFFIGKPQSLATYIHVNDVVRSMILVANNQEAKGKIYNLSNDCFFEEMIEGMTQSLNISSRKFRISEKGVRLASRVVNFFIQSPLTDERINALVLRTRYPTEKIKKELGYAPIYYIPDIIGEVILANNQNKKIKIARVVTVPIVYTHILDLLHSLENDSRFELHLVCSQGEFLEEMRKRFPGAFFHIINISRNINLAADLVSLFYLTRLFLKERFDVVHSHTPKAGLISAIAGYLSRVKIRIHSFTGQVWANTSGAKKWILVSLDKLITILNTHNYADSMGQKSFLISNGIGNEKNLSVLHKGSLGGINVNRFDPIRLQSNSNSLRVELFPNFSGTILIYLGRLNRDKGLQELQTAFFSLKKKHSLKLLLVGPIETIEDLDFKLLIDNFRSDSDVVMVNFTDVPEIYIGCADIFCFPSYREGFGTVALEASAMEKPIIASNIYGLSDAVVDKETGLLFEVKNAHDLEVKIDLLLSRPELATQLGKKGRERVISDFSDKILTEKLKEDYLKMVEY